jgi:hypothetical protein
MCGKQTVTIEADRKRGRWTGAQRDRQAGRKAGWQTGREENM